MALRYTGYPLCASASEGARLNVQKASIDSQRGEKVSLPPWPSGPSRGRGRTHVRVRLLGLRRQGEETAVLAARDANPAHRSAIDTGGRDTREEAAVEARVVRFQRQVTRIIGGVDGRVVHAVDRTRAVGPGWPFPDICRPVGRPTISTDTITISGNLTMQLAPSIFKAYDIRGVVPSTVDEAVAEGIGRAFGTIARKEGETTVAVGRDGRLSGPSLSGALMRGLVAAGLEVIDVGMVTTPMLYFAANTLCTSGIQVTGSHNPKAVSYTHLTLPTSDLV